MANALQWPEYLPCPNLSGYTGSIDLGLEQSPMEGGGLRTRQAYNNYGMDQRFSFALSPSQAARLFSFIAEAGSASFDVEVVTPEDPYGLYSTCSAKFVGSLQRSPVGQSTFNYSVSVFVEELTPPSADDMYIFDVFGVDPFGVSDLLDRAVNQELPA